MHIKPPEITESVSELKRLLRKTSVGYQKQRLTALYLFRSGQAITRKQVAERLGVSRKTIGHWIATYETEELDALLDRDYSPGVPLGYPKNNKSCCERNFKNQKVFPVINR